MARTRAKRLPSGFKTVVGMVLTVAVVGTTVGVLWRHWGGHAAPGGLGRAAVSSELAVHDSLSAERGLLSGCNVLLVTLDTVRADHIGCYGNRRIDTPTLDELARAGVLFSEVIAPTPITLPSHASILTGRYPDRHGARMNALYRLGDEHETLAEVLARHGYATGAVLSAFVLDSRFGLAQGFGDYDDKLGGEKQQHWGNEHWIIPPERPANETTQRSAAWLRDHQDGPFFLWVHYFDPHAPYVPPSLYAERYQDNRYDGEIAFVDAQLGVLLHTLDELGHTADTLVVVVGDHGESLYEQIEAVHGYLLYNSTLHVPLIMRCGDRLGGGVHLTQRTSLVDIMPTVLALLDIAPPADLDGVALMDTPDSPPLVFAESLYGLVEHGWAPLFAVVDGPYKYIHGPAPELYALDADALEKENLVGAQPELTEKLRASLVAHFGPELERTVAPAVTEALNAEELAKLRALGYVGHSAADRYEVNARPDPKEMVPLLTRIEMAGHMMAIGRADFAATVAAVEDVIRERPDFLTAYRDLAELYRRRGRLAEAEAALQRGLAQRPDDIQLLGALGQSKYQQGRSEEALALYRQVVAAYPDSHDHLTGLAGSLLKCHRYDEALEVMKKLVTMAPEDGNACRGLVQAAMGAGRPTEARDLLMAALEAHPGLIELRLALVGLCGQRGQYAEGIALLRDGVARMPDNLELMHQLAGALMQVDDPEARDVAEAARILEWMCQRTRYQHAQYMLTLSRAYMELGRKHDAIATAQNAHRVAMESGQVGLAEAIAAALEEYRGL